MDQSNCCQIKKMGMTHSFIRIVIFSISDIQDVSGLRHCGNLEEIILSSSVDPRILAEVKNVTQNKNIRVMLL